VVHHSGTFYDGRYVGGDTSIVEQCVLMPPNLSRRLEEPVVVFVCVV